MFFEDVLRIVVISLVLPLSPYLSPGLLTITGVFSVIALGHFWSRQISLWITRFDVCSFEIVRIVIFLLLATSGLATILIAQVHVQLQCVSGAIYQVKTSPNSEFSSCSSGIIGGFSISRSNINECSLSTSRFEGAAIIENNDRLVSTALDFGNKYWGVLSTSANQNLQKLSVTLGYCESAFNLIASNPSLQEISLSMSTHTETYLHVIPGRSRNPIGPHTFCFTNVEDNSNLRSVKLLYTSADNSYRSGSIQHIEFSHQPRVQESHLAYSYAADVDISFRSNPSLTILKFESIFLFGSIQISSNPSLRHISFPAGQLSVLGVSNCSSLDSLSANFSLFGGPLLFQNNAALESISLKYDIFTPPSGLNGPAIDVGSLMTYSSHLSQNSELQHVCLYASHQTSSI